MIGIGPVRIINESLLERFRAKRHCERCGSPTPWGCEPHHIFAKGMGGARRLDVRENLIALCHTCHDLFHLGRIERRELLGLVAARDGKDVEYLEELLYLLIRTRGR